MGVASFAERQFQWSKDFMEYCPEEFKTPIYLVIKKDRLEKERLERERLERERLERERLEKEHLEYIERKRLQYEEERRKEKLLEDLKEHFSENLLSTAGRSSDTWKYLTEKRAFTEEQIETIGFGLFEGEKLLQFAQKHNYSIEEVKKHFNKKTLTEQQHTVVIPYYSGGKLHGFQLRIDGDYDTEKYQVTTGLKRGELLFNSPAFFTQKQNIILTEGEIDCLSLQHKLFGGEGAIHCLSLGGNSKWKPSSIAGTSGVFWSRRTGRVGFCYSGAEPA
jgi:hypothetical protein